MHRVLISPDAVTRDSVTVRDPEHVHHLVRVLRIKDREILECFDGYGHGYRGPITHVTPSAVTMDVAERREEPAPRVPVALAQALIKPERFEWVVQKATELSVARILPLVCARGAAQGTGASEQRLTRWRRIAEEAAAQCGRCTVPVLETPREFRQAMETAASGLRLLLTLAESGTSLSALAPQVSAASAVTILIGPEGDFTPEEVAVAKQFGARVVSLGQATLRSETAAIAVLTIVQHLVGML